MSYKATIEQLISKGHQFPALAHVYTMEVDRLLRAAGESPITFSANEWAKESKASVKRLGLSVNFAARKNSKDGNTIFTAESLVKQGARSEALAHIFTHATGPQVNGLNLFYANYASQTASGRLHYLNKYLNAYNLKLELSETKKTDFFQRLTSGKIIKKIDGPLVTVIMPARNAATTLELAVNSLINQSWHNLQIIIVDDASTDDTLIKAKNLAKQDQRIEVLNSPVNVGPYVCRNLGVLHTRGKWLTVHDADDWAFPDRIEQQVKAMKDSEAASCTGGMLRMNAQGQITRPGKVGSFNVDGYQWLCFVSLMVEAEVFRNQLGAWDSVWVAGDAEMLDRIKVLKIETTHLVRPLMLCLDNPAGLTNHPVLGLLDKEEHLRDVRSNYKRAYESWHRTESSKKLSQEPVERRFAIPKGIFVDQAAISEALEQKDKKKKVSSVSSPDMSNPKRVLLNANEVAKSGDHDRAIALAEEHLPAELAYTANILRANAAISVGDDVGWLRHLNEYLAKFDVAPIGLEGKGSIFDRLTATPLPAVTGGPLVSVIMPACNAEKTVRKAAQSILNQTWRNLELLIVDDASTDGTWVVLQEIAANDSRVKIARNTVNVGPYVSKNVALSMASGCWITGHDADDWALPERIEKQVSFCNQKGLTFCISGMLRLQDNGSLVRLNAFGKFVFDGAARSGLISLMIHSQYFYDVLGGWDNVRTSGDSEILCRIEALQGKQVQQLNVVTMLCLDNPEGLTNHPELGYREGQPISKVRLEYKKLFQEWHSTINKSNARIDILDLKRKFSAPEKLLPDPGAVEAIVKNHRLQGVDFGRVISVELAIITNAVFSGGNASSTIDELKWARERGIDSVLIHCPVDAHVGRPTSERCEGENGSLVSWSKIRFLKCRVLICRHPAVATSEAFRQLRTRLTTEHAFIVINNSCVTPDGNDVYRLDDLLNSAESIPAPFVTVCPVSPVIRGEIEKVTTVRNNLVRVSEHDWAPTFDLSLYYQAPKVSMRTPFRIGRHGRDGSEKWLEDAKLLSLVYPHDGDFQISILGGAKVAKKIMGGLAENWSVREFGSIEPFQYLSELDVFVYFPHTRLTEAFGRTIVEAMLAGVPVILPPRFEATFGCLSLYCSPGQVANMVRRLARHDELRIAYLSEIQRIAVERFSSRVISHRLATTGLPGLAVTEESRLALTAPSRKYRECIMEFKKEVA